SRHHAPCTEGRGADRTKNVREAAVLLLRHNAAADIAGQWIANRGEFHGKIRQRSVHLAAEASDVVINRDIERAARIGRITEGAVDAGRAVTAADMRFELGPVTWSPQHACIPY